ncbi:MAG: phosphotriesterase-related protein [Armatimonadota bacterium]|nr:phosphotriesterase-related protein [Armatimonadota bacterium]
MAHIHTVTGPVAPAAMGITYMHEHILCDQRRCRNEGLRPRGSDDGLMILDDADVAVRELSELRSLGADAMVEVTMQAWGRDVVALRAISEASGLRIIATSGFYIEACHPDFVATQSVDELADGLVRELTEGVDGTGIRTGLLKAAVGRTVVEGPEEKCARAVARAQRATGAAITTHTSGSARFEIPGGNIGMFLLDLFEAEGVDPARVIVGHVDEKADVRHLEALCRRGAYVQFDVIGKSHWMLDETRADLVTALVERGFITHLLLSTDRNRKFELRAYGGIGYAHLLTAFVPMLRRRGLSEDHLTQILVENPRRALAIGA